MRPRGVGVRVVALPGDRVDPDQIAVLHAARVVDEARDDVLAEHVARPLLAEVLVRPVAVVGILVV